MPGHFISGGGDGAVIFWSLENPRPLFVLNTIEGVKKNKKARNRERVKKKYLFFSRLVREKNWTTKGNVKREIKKRISVLSLLTVLGTVHQQKKTNVRV